MKSPEFPLFPHRLFRPNPQFLEGGLSKDTVDPWARRDLWRHDKFFSAKNRIKRAFPGLSLGMGALAIYILYDDWYQKTGPGKKENDRLAKYMEERAHRLGSNHGHH